MSSYDSVVQVNIRVTNMVEDVNGEGQLAAAREGGDELRGGVGVLVEIGFEDLSVDLFDVVEIGEVLKELEHPTWAADRKARLHGRKWRWFRLVLTVEKKKHSFRLSV